MTSSTTPPPVPVKQKSNATPDNAARLNDSPTNPPPPRVPERRPSLAHIPTTDLTTGKRNSALSEEEDFPGPPIPKRTVSFNRSIVNKTEPEDGGNTSAPKKPDLPDSPKPPPIPKKKTPLKV